MLNFVKTGAWVVGLTTAAVTQAGILTVSDSGLTDFDSNINATADFTHAINIGANVADDVTVNGIVFDAYANPVLTNPPFSVFPGVAADDQSGNSYQLSGDGNFTFPTSGGSALTGAAAGFASGLGAIGILGSGTTMTIELGGLIEGTTYDLTLYYLNFDGMNRAASFVDGGAFQGVFVTDAIDPGDADNRTGTIVTYRYTADDSFVSFDIVGAVFNTTPHLHAFSNEVVVPEPSSLALLSIGGLFVARRRRSIM